ncbi:MAG: hypothetical protein OEY33_09535, partial [Bdellovibrionales bacterium]|nr:hypothetical protein [Bdellovibrionales bacterium]
MEKVISRSLIITLFLFSTILQASERIYKSSILLDSPNNEFVKKAKSVRFLDYLKEVKTYLKQLDSNQKHHIEKRQKENQAFRPSSCPLKSTKYQTISAKIHLVMEELKNNPKCSNALEGTFKNINESLDKLKVLEDEYKTNYDLFNEDATTKTETEIENEKSELLKRKVVINGVQSMLTSFTTVASNSECQETMTATQITSNLSDAIFGISGLGLLAPGAAGYGTAVGGMAIGSLLKVISILIKPTWDFEKDKDRNNFVKISCSLFDLKTDIEEAGLLSNRTTETSSEAKSIQRIINEIDEHIGILNASSYNYSKARYVFEKPLMIKALSTTKEGFNDPNVRLHQHFLKTRNILAAAINANNSDERADILIDLFDIHQKIQGILSKSSMSLKVNREAKFRDLPTSKIEWKKVVLGAKSGDELWQKVLKNRKTEKEDFKNFTDNFMNIIKWLETYQHSLIRKKKGGFSKVLSDPRFKAKMIIKKLINYRSSLDDRLNFLNSLAVGRVFSDSDDGAI